MTVERTPGLGRRGFLGAAGLTLLAAPLLPARPARSARAAARFAYPFTLGVASGEPTADGFVVWTRLAPDPLAEDGGAGMPPQQVEVQWQVAEDDRFAEVVRSGTRTATPDLGHSVHVEVSGLDPSREYFYRFRVGGDVSEQGRTTTAPAAGSPTRQLSFALASCQNYPDGYYPAYRDMLRQDLDFVLFLGDYVYEGDAQGDLGRGHLPAREVFTLGEYRRRFAQYKTDPDLQAVHAAYPWVASVDDHDVDNNWAGDHDGHGDTEGFLERRAAAFQAFYEHLPMRRSSLPRGPDMRLYRRLGYGDLAEFYVLDTRQYRDVQAVCADAERVGGYCPGALADDRTILGADQRRWLFEGLGRRRARWSVVAHQTRFAPYDLQEGPGRYYGRGLDPWGDGYVVERTALLDTFDQARVRNPVLLGGDAHRNWVFDLQRDFADPGSATVATELVGTSVSSGGDTRSIETGYGGTPDNPYERFVNAQRGYVHCRVAPDAWQADFRVSDTVRTRDASLYTLASFTVEDGRPGAVLT